MGTGLFDSPSRSASRAGTPRDEAELYRALSGAAIAAGAVALVSPLVFFGWWLATVPVIGVVLAVIALRDIARRRACLYRDHQCER